MFYGEFEHTLDTKDRLIIPSRFREVLDENQNDSLYITRGLDGCLFLFTEDEWRTQEMKFKSLSFTSKDARKFNRLFFSGASEVECDKQGRVLIPKYLKEYAGIDKEVVVLGISNRIEVWDKKRWEEFYGGHRDTYEDIADGLFREKT